MFRYSVRIASVVMSLMVLPACAALAQDPPKKAAFPGDHLVVPPNVLTASPSQLPADFSWLTELKAHVPVLKHSTGKIPPMIVWEDFSSNPLTADQVHALLDRGFTQHLKLDEASIPAARALQSAGSPVILLQGAGGPWPSDQAGDPSVWAHKLDAGYKPAEPVRACISLTAGWAKEADQIRRTLRQFKEAGVTVNGVWMDWEGDPLYGKDRYDQAIHCERCRETLPPRVLASRAAFEAYARRRFVELIGAYLAAPVLEVFPACSVTNWNAMVSTPEKKLADWDADNIDPSMPAFFTATNTAAYGDTSWWRLWKPQFVLDQEHVDRFWTYQLIRQVSDETLNRKRWMPEKSALPWVGRWLPEHDLYHLPVMSRERYRELLRHLWLRGIAGMQVFNPRFKGYDEMAIFELQDAATVYAEMITYHELIEKGEPINLAYPGVQDGTVLWSGLRTADRAVIRAFAPDAKPQTIKIEVWPGYLVKLQADNKGANYLIERNGNSIKISRQ